MVISKHICPCLGLHTCLSSSDYDYNKDGSIGVLSEHKHNVMQWFALALLGKGLPFRRPKERIINHSN